MSNPREPSQTGKGSPPLELPVRPVHNRRHVLNGGKPDQHVVALVQLLARLAAKEDFRNEHDDR